MPINMSMTDLLSKYPILEKKVRELEEENIQLSEAFKEIILSDVIEDNQNPVDIIAINALKACVKWYEDHGKDYEIGTPHCFLNAQYIISYIDGNTD